MTRNLIPKNKQIDLTDIFAGLDDKLIEDNPSEIGKQIFTKRREAINEFIDIYTAIERISEKVSHRGLAKWLLTHTHVKLEDWYKQAVILPNEDRKRIRKRLKKALDHEKDRDDRVKRMAAQMDISEVETYSEPSEDLTNYGAEDLHNAMPSDHEWNPEDDENRFITLPDTTAECKKLLAQAWKLEKSHRIKVGRIYYQLQELVRNGKVGIDPKTNRDWEWTKWAEVYIGRPYSTIQDNIRRYLDSLPK
jgi:hypothetical protein